METREPFSGPGPVEVATWGGQEWEPDFPEATVKRGGGDAGVRVLGAAQGEQCERTEQWEPCVPLPDPPSQLCSSAPQDGLRPSQGPRTSS